MRLARSARAWEDYVYWQQVDRKKVKRINALVKAAMRAPFEGIGGPEPLKHELQGFWSRRIDREHRLVYSYVEAELLVVACRYHY